MSLDPPVSARELVELAASATISQSLLVLGETGSRFLIWQNFPSPSLLITGEVRRRPAPLTSCSVVLFPSHSHLGPHPLLLWVLLGSWTQ